MPREDTQYVIKDMIVFNVLDNTLWTKDNPEDTLTLGLVTGRLFHYLLANAGQVIGKDELLSNVWDEYGLRSSGHSLNQNISLLRKSLVLLGCESEVISTFPRKGYFINNDIVDIRHRKIVKVDISRRRDKIETTSFRSLLRLLTTGGLSFIMLVGTIAFLKSNSSNELSDIPLQSLQPINKLGECPIFTTKSGVQAHEKLYILAQNMIAHTLSPCPGNVFYIISADDSVILSNESGRIFLTQCLHDKGAKFISGCNTIYERDYSKKD